MHDIQVARASRRPVVIPPSRYRCRAHLNSVNWRGRGCEQCAEARHYSRRRRRDRRRRHEETND